MSWRSISMPTRTPWAKHEPMRIDGRFHDLLAGLFGDAEAREAIVDRSPVAMHKGVGVLVVAYFLYHRDLTRHPVFGFLDVPAPILGSTLME